jgi:hypothetical protein
MLAYHLRLRSRPCYDAEKRCPGTSCSSNPETAAAGEMDHLIGQQFVTYPSCLHFSGSSREHSWLRNKKEIMAIQSQRPSSRPGAILSLLGGILVIYGVFFLPMVIGNGGGSATLHSEWDAATNGTAVALVLLADLLLGVLLVLGTSAASFFRALSPRMVIWRRIIALAGLIIQGPVGLVGAVLYTFSIPPQLGAGYWLVLIGFIVMSVGTFRDRPLQRDVERR